MKHFIALALAGLCLNPAHAAECRNATAEQVLADIEADGGVILDTFNYEGMFGDTLVFYEIDGNVWMVGLSGECYQAGPTLIDAIRKKDAGTPA